MMNDTLHLSDRGIHMLCNLEGFRAYPYDDKHPDRRYIKGIKLDGTLTIGFGHTFDWRKEWYDKDITREQGMSLLRWDLGRYEGIIKLSVHVALTQNQFDALVIFCYNIGINAFKNSTLVKLLNAGNFAGAAQQFSRWVMANNRPDRVLCSRRKKEQTLFITGAYA